MVNTKTHQNKLWACLQASLSWSGPETEPTEYILSKMDQVEPQGTTLGDLLDYMYRHHTASLTKTIICQAMECTMSTCNNLIYLAMHHGYIKRVSFDGNCAAYQYAKPHEEGLPDV